MPGQRSVCVVGSGITGLATGALLARMGHAVIVLEAHPDTLGGHARSFSQDGFRFCAGPQYVWGFGAGEIGHRVLSFLDLAESVPFDAMAADGFERIFVGDEGPFDVPMGLSRFFGRLAQWLPDEAARIAKAGARLTALSEAARVIADEAWHVEPPWRMGLRAFVRGAPSVGARRALLRDAWRSFGQMCDRLGLSPRARRLIYGTGAVYGEPLDEVSTLAFAGGLGLYHGGACVPRHGFDSLIDGLAAAIRRDGGTVRTGQRVVRLERSGDRVSRVVLASGESLRPDVVVSNLAPRTTYGLLALDRPPRTRYRPSHSALGCFFGVRGMPELHDALAGRNLWWYRDDRPLDYRPSVDAPPAVLFVGSPSAHGTGNRNPDPDDVSIAAFTAADFEPFRAAVEEDVAVHDEFRVVFRQRMLDALEAHLFPGLRAHVRTARVITPWDVHVDTGAEEGGVYGRRLTARDVVTGIGPHHGIRNLHIACATVGLPGILMGIRTAARLVETLTGELV